MSVIFEKEIDEESIKRLLEIFGNPVADYKKTFLFDKIEKLDQKVMGELARQTGQPVTVELNDKGTTKRVDGRGIRTILASFVDEGPQAADALEEMGFDFELFEEGWEKK